MIKWSITWLSVALVAALAVGMWSAVQARAASTVESSVALREELDRVRGRIKEYVRVCCTIR